MEVRSDAWGPEYDPGDQIGTLPQARYVIIVHAEEYIMISSESTACCPPDFLRGPRRLLIVRLRNLGDCILSTPVVRALKQWNPSLKISLLVESRFAGVYHGNPHIDHLEILPRSGSALERLRQRWHCAVGLRKGQFDCTWNLHGGSTSLYFTLASRSSVRIGYAHYRQSSRYTHLAPSAALIWGKSPIHTVENQLAPLKWLGIVQQTEGLNPEVFLSAESTQAVDRFLREHIGHDQPFVLVQPTATLRTKQWPEERFSRLIQKIQREENRKVVLSVGPGEAETARKVLAAGGLDLPVFQGKNLEELKSVLHRAELFIGNDSGPMHLAAALKKPVLAIFTSSHFEAWHPWGTPFLSCRSSLPCVPCPGYRCYEYENARCVDNISVDQVWQGYRELRRRSFS